MHVEKAIEVLKKEWSTPKHPRHRGEVLEQWLRCEFDKEGVKEEELKEISTAIPEDVSAFWKVSRTAKLFEDYTYGQWGLRFLSPTEAKNESIYQMEQRPEDFYLSDLIIGKFIGDSDLLGIRCDQKETDFGSVFISLPLDRRADWYFLNILLGNFMNQYLKAEGDKFWQIGKGRVDSEKYY